MGYLWQPITWIVLIILISVPVILSHETTPESQATKAKLNGPEDLVCFLRKKQMEGCSNVFAEHSNGTGISPRIRHLYSKMSLSLRELIAQGSLASAAPQTFSELHPVVFYLMPHGDERLRAGGEALARYVRVRGGETAAIIVSTALLDDVDERDLFISKLAGVLLSERSQSLLGEHLAEWFPGTDDWKYERFGKALKAGNPLVGSLPSPFLTSMPSVAIERFLFLLSQWETYGSSRGDQWFSKGKAVARTWSSMIMKSQHPHHLSHWKTLSYQRYYFLLLGFTPDELLHMSTPHREVWSSIFQLKFDKLQARAVFQAVVGNGSTLKENDVKNGIPLYATPILPLLSPNQLAKSFNHSVADFSGLNYQPAKRFENPSFVTALQLSHCLIAQDIYAKILNFSTKVNGSSNGTTHANVEIILSFDGPSSAEQGHLALESFINAGRFAYSLPVSYFINRNITKIHPKSLKDIDSDELTLFQGRLLTRHLILHLEDDRIRPLNQSTNGSFIVKGDDLIMFGPGLLRGLFSSSSIAALNIHEVPQKVLQHLLDVDKPWRLSRTEELSLRSLAILQKLGNEIGQPWVLNHVLGSASSVQILKYLPPQELAAVSKDIVANSNVITLSSLHVTTLSGLLDVAMPELLLRGPGGGKWSSEALTSGAMPLLRGMSCRHLELVDPHDVIVVLGHYNKQRHMKGRFKYQPFPKNLQNCAIRAVASHLELKASLWSGGKVNFNPNILQALEASDIESVGGFIIAGLPEEVLAYLGADALRLVGQLSPQELLLALFGRHHPSDIALILLKQLGMASDMEISSLPKGNHGVRGEPKYSVGRMGLKWREWSGKKGSLIPLLFGSLLQFLPPDIVDAASLKWTLETANPGGALVCLGSKQRQSWYSTLVEAFGPPEDWSGSDLGTIGDFLLVVPEEYLDRIPKTSWTDAADTLVERTGYFTRNIETPSGFLSYYEFCTKVLPQAEEGMYVNAVKGLARSMLESVQRQMDSITPYWKILGRLTPGLSSGGGRELVPVPGLRRPLLIGSTALDDSHLNSSGKYSRKERTSDELPESDRRAVMKVSCNAIRAVAPEIVALALKPKDLDLLTPQEIGECVDILGLAPLEGGMLRMVWAKAKESELPLELVDLGKLVSVMSLEDLLAFNITISSDLDAVSVLGREISNWEMINHLVPQILPDEAEPMGVEAVAAMGALLCGLPPERLPKPRVMFRVAQFVSQSLAWDLRGRGCPPHQCLRTLANVTSSWLGRPIEEDSWTAAELAFMGVLSAGLDAEVLKSLAGSGGSQKWHMSLNGLDISAIECMPELIVKSLSSDHVSQLSQLAAMRLMERNPEALTEDARSALEGLDWSPFDFIEFQERRGGEEVEESSMDDGVGVDGISESTPAASRGCLVLPSHGVTVMLYCWMLLIQCYRRSENALVVLLPYFLKRNWLLS